MCSLCVSQDIKDDRLVCSLCVSQDIKDDRLVCSLCVIQNIKDAKQDNYGLSVKLKKFLPISLCLVYVSDRTLYTDAEKDNYRCLQNNVSISLHK